MEERPAAMVRRLQRTAERAGVREEGRDLIRRAFELAIAHRGVAIVDPEHPDYLHTGRTALILLDDSGCGDAVALAAATLFDSADSALVPGRPAIAIETSEDVAMLVGSVPTPSPGNETLLEQLVSAPAAAVLIAIADHLDHARHLHLAPRERWGAFHALSRSVYLPAAGRASAALERRLDWWCRMFESRYLDV